MDSLDLKLQRPWSLIQSTEKFFSRYPNHLGWNIMRYRNGIFVFFQVVEITSSTRTSNTSYNHTNNDNEGLDYLRALVPRIKQEAKEWEIKADSLEIELLSLKRELKKRDQENGNLQREVHKLRVSQKKFVLNLCRLENINGVGDST